MNKKYLFVIGFIVLVIVAIAVLVILRGDEDTWLCQNGQWVKHGNSSAAMPTSSCGTILPSSSPSPSQVSEIMVSFPKPNQKISSPIQIFGRAKGSWYFEAVFPIKLLDSQDHVLASGQAQAQSDWMTEEFVPFAAQLTYSLTATTTGTLVFNNDNPSDLPQNSKEFRVPVILGPAGTK